MKAISLFSGAIDGLGIAAETAGMTVTHHVEWDNWCCSVLRRNHPNSKVFCGDIKDYRHNGSPIDVVLGSPPCQGFSVAGNRRGFADERYLWPEMYRIVLSLRPRYVVFENVAGAVSAGLLDQVCSDLESADYECWPLVYPACIFGAPHQRERLFIVAYAISQRHERPEAVEQPAHDEKRNIPAHQQGGNAKSDANISGRPVVGYPRRAGLQKQQLATVTGDERHTARQYHSLGNSPRSRQSHQQGISGARRTRQSLRQFGHQQQPLPQSRLGRAADGTAAGIHRPDPAQDFPGWPAGQGAFQYPYEPSRTVAQKALHHAKRIEALGNAVVWQQAYPLMRVIAKHFKENL